MIMLLSFTARVPCLIALVDDNISMQLTMERKYIQPCTNVNY